MSEIEEVISSVLPNAITSFLLYALHIGEVPSSVNYF